MSRDNTNQIIAHVDLLRAVDRLLSQAEVVRQKRHALDQLLSDPSDTVEPTQILEAEEVSHGD